MLSSDGTLALPLEAGTRLFVSGGAFFCLENTVYQYALGLSDPGPPWSRAILETDADRTIEVAVPQGAHDGGWPGPNEWSFQDGPTLRVDWDLAAADSRARIEYRIVLAEPPSLVSGGCHPDPLAQPPRHLDETVNVTRPPRPPEPNARTEAADACATDCVTMVPLETDAASPFPNIVIIAAVLAMTAFDRRRRKAEAVL